MAYLVDLMRERLPLYQQNGLEWGDNIFSKTEMYAHIGPHPLAFHEAERGEWHIPVQSTYVFVSDDCFDAR